MGKLSFERMQDGKYILEDSSQLEEQEILKYLFLVFPASIILFFLFVIWDISLYGYDDSMTQFAEIVDLFMIIMYIIFLTFQRSDMGLISYKPLIIDPVKHSVQIGVRPIQIRSGSHFNLTRKPGYSTIQPTFNWEFQSILSNTKVILFNLNAPAEDENLVISTAKQVAKFMNIPFNLEIFDGYFDEYSNSVLISKLNKSKIQSTSSFGPLRKQTINPDQQHISLNSYPTYSEIKYSPNLTKIRILYFIEFSVAIILVGIMVTIGSPIIHDHQLKNIIHWSFEFFFHGVWFILVYRIIVFSIGDVTFKIDNDYLEITKPGILRQSKTAIPKTDLQKIELIEAFSTFSIIIHTKDLKSRINLDFNMGKCSDCPNALYFLLKDKLK